MMYLGQGYKPICIKGLLKAENQTNKKEKASVTYVPVPSAAELTTEGGLAALENVLKGHRYLAGDKATQVDVLAFEHLTESPSYWKFKVRSCRFT